MELGGEITKLLQERLVYLGYNTNWIDGVFGYATLSAIKNFQLDRELINDGIVGWESWRELIGI